MRTKTFLALLFSLNCALAPILEAKDTLVVGYTSAPPFIIADSSQVSGISFWLWERIAAELAIPYRLEERTFPDIISGLKDRSLDMSINPLTMTADRSEHFVFASPFYVATDAVAMKDISRWQKALRMLKRVVSFELLSAIILLFLVISVFGVLTWLFERKRNSDDFRPNHKGLWDGVWWSTVTMTTVGYGDKTPKSFGGKVIALIWMFTALLVVSGFTGSIASSIMAERLEMNITDFNSLKKEPVGTMENTTTLSFLRSRFFKKVRTFPSIEEGLQAVEEGEIKAFIYDEPILKYRSNEAEHDHLQILESNFNLQLYAFALSETQHDLVHEVSQKVLKYTSTIEWTVLLNEYGLEIK